ncbi:MAG: hypothetical protein JW934_09440 [Anaerolineae bacterium]|nr:hypothetical protein [Anaerolineae bacterium]
MNQRFTFERFAFDGIHLSCIRQINALPDEAKYPLYRTLFPQHILDRHCPASSPLDTTIRCLPNTGFVEFDVRHPDNRRDPLLYFQMADTVNGQIEVLLLIVNDPFAPRFDVDQHWQGEITKLDSRPRNILAEIAAMDAGLAPGQVRQGLHLSRELIPVMEQFMIGLGKDRFFIEPLAYHAAIMFERYGFSYMTGQRKMEQIHLDFQPGGPLYEKLDGSTPFRRPELARTVRGRSWAIHDGILDTPWGSIDGEIRMYKRIGLHAGVCTCSDAIY